MSENKAASRYAKSLIDLSTEQNALEEMRSEMVLIEQVIDQNSELEAILQNPVIPLDKNILFWMESLVRAFTQLPVLI